MKKILDENVTKPFLHEIVVDEIVNCFGRKCFWTKVFLDESVFGRVFFFFANWMKMYLTGSPQCDSVLVEGRHHGGVNGELSTSVEPQPVRQHFEASPVAMRMNVLVRTRAPASRHTLAAADSRAHPLRPKTPAFAQAAR